MKRKEKLENLIDELEILNFDIRKMSDCQIRQYLQLKFKLLDFGLALLSKSDAEEDHLDNYKRYSDEQWDYILDNLFAENEYYHLECFFRSCLIKFHENNVDVLSNIKILPLAIE